MSSREQIYVLETIKAMKKKIARDAIGEPIPSSPLQNMTRGEELSSCPLTLLFL